MKDSESKMKSPEGQRLYKATEDIIKNNKFKRDLFLISIPTKIHIVSAMMLGRLLKKHYPDCHICFGGAYITISGMGEYFVNEDYCDTFITGPGERKITELLEKLKNNPKGEITARDDKRADINAEINTHPGEQELTRVVLSVGCIWGKCTFCDYPTQNAYFAIKRLDVLLKELENLIENHRKKKFYFITDAIPPGYARLLSNSIISKGWKISWAPRFLRIYREFDAELFRLMKKSGCNFKLVHVGLESFSDRALKLVNKGYTKSVAVRFFAEAEKAGIIIKQINLIYDLPGTSFMDALESVDILERFIETYERLAVFPFQLTSSSYMGKHPEKYGLEIVNKDTGKRKMPFCNNLDYIDRNGFTNDERKTIKNKLYHLHMSLKAGRKYKNLDKRKYNSIKLYSQDKVKIEVKIPSQLEKISTKNGKIYIHSDKLADDIIIESQYFLSKVNPGRWYSVEELASFKKFDNHIKRFINLQETFRYVRELLAIGYFSDVRLIDGGETSENRNLP